MKKLILFLLFAISLSLFGGERFITIGAVGDIMLGTNYPDESYLPEKDGSNLMRAAYKYFKKVDVLFGNLEGPLADNAPLHKKCSNPKNCYAFKTPTTYIKNYIEAGFHLLNLANNHSGDFGEEGRVETKATLEKAGIAYSGIIGDIAIIEKKGKKIGMIGFAPNWGTYSINNIPEASKLVKELSKKVDIVIVSFHGGAEGKNASNVVDGMENYLGENRGDLKKFTHEVIDAGADIVIGHGPHVPRGTEIYKNRLILYSLGNFTTYGRFSLKGKAGYAPFAMIDLAEDGSFVSGEIVSFKQIGRGGIEFDSNHSAAKEISRLTKEDFPNTEISISNSGKISKKTK
ncbi:CapA family protein [bacterium]|nr:CapA family protein [bacterium]